VKKLAALILSTIMIMMGAMGVSAKEIVNDEQEIAEVISVVTLNDGSVVNYYDNGCYVIYSIVADNSVTRSVVNTSKVKQADAYDGYGKLIAEVAMTAYFQVDYGVDVSCYNILTGQNLYNGWYLSSVSKDKGTRGSTCTAKATFYIAHQFHSAIPVTTSVTMNKYNVVV